MDLTRYRAHGLPTPEYSSWRALRARCNWEGGCAYHRYGGRGITVCERWDSFENFLEDMGPRPGPGYTVERIDNDGHYEPGNCTWDTRKEQNRNRSNNHVVEYEGESLCIAELVDKTGLSRGRLERGLKKRWDFDKVFTPPIGEEIGRKPCPLKPGDIIGSLTVIRRDGHLGEAVAWLCSCSACGSTKRVRGSHLKNRRVKTCGCGQGGKGIPNSPKE